MSRYQMPEITIPATFTGRDREIAEAILNKGKLRASKPKDGEAAYVWRMVAFTVSPVSQHQCMPMTADFDMPEQYWPPRKPPEHVKTRGDWREYLESAEYREASRKAHDARRERIKELTVLIDALIASVPVRQWKGALRWARAFGSTTTVEGL